MITLRFILYCLWICSSANSNDNVDIYCIGEGGPGCILSEAGDGAGVAAEADKQAGKQAGTAVAKLARLGASRRAREPAS